MSSRHRLLFFAGAGLLAAWLLAAAGYMIAERMRVTAEKVRDYGASIEWSTLSPADRASALQRLARMLNALTLEERREVRFGREWERFFAALSEAEKAQLIEATMPTGFKQMIGAFEQLPEEQRRRAISEAMRNLKEAQSQWQTNASPGAFTNTVVLSEDLQRQVATIGLRTFYSQSSAQTKAELAPVLEEMQRMMESGRFVMGRRRGR